MVFNSHNFTSLIWHLLNGYLRSSKLSQHICQKKVKALSTPNIITIFVQNTDKKTVLKLWLLLMFLRYWLWFSSWFYITTVSDEAVFDTYQSSLYWCYNMLWQHSSTAHYRPIWMPVMFAQIDFTTKPIRSHCHSHWLCLKVIDSS